MEISLKDLKEILGDRDKSCPFVVGEKYFICTVTKYFTGELVSIKGDFIELKDAAWIADTGKLTSAMENSNNFSEVELYSHNIGVNLNTIVDYSIVNTLPRSSK